MPPRQRLHDELHINGDGGSKSSSNSSGAVPMAFTSGQGAAGHGKTVLDAAVVEVCRFSLVQFTSIGHQLQQLHAAIRKRCAHVLAPLTPTGLLSLVTHGSQVSTANSCSASSSHRTLETSTPC